ncbi:hypothetical protein [Roseivirga sp. E12]|uniref:hypothetical protein n=1 Tax=Roseivirga sp. E12 TaxID=2819237 RepID=UPI001ABC2D47|nr:hypothetical protein [Roseivirga sp. E12]MBO3700032.1 hypothetical protein [Roseivirga sp. E12]
MRYRDIIILTIKLSATYAMFQYLVYAIPQQVMFNHTINIDSTGYGHLVLGALSVLLVFWLIIYFTPWFVDNLRLAKGFKEEKIDLAGMKESSIYRAALIIICLFILMTNSPELITQVYFRFKADVSVDNITYNNDENLFYYVVQVLMSIIVLGNAGRIARWFAKV